jgi:hypothetical protein
MIARKTTGLEIPIGHLLASKHAEIAPARPAEDRGCAASDTVGVICGLSILTEYL